MNGLGDTNQYLTLVCQVVDKDFYPLGGAFPVEVLPKQYIGVAVDRIKSSEHIYQTISDLGIIDDLVSINSIGATLWKLSTPCPIAGKGKRAAVEKLLEAVRREKLSLVEELDKTLGISDYFDENLPRGHLHVLLQLAISGVDGANPL